MNIKLNDEGFFSCSLDLFAKMYRVEIKLIDGTALRISKLKKHEKYLSIPRQNPKSNNIIIFIILLFCNDLSFASLIALIGE